MSDLASAIPDDLLLSDITNLSPNNVVSSIQNNLPAETKVVEIPANVVGSVLNTLDEKD